MEKTNQKNNEETRDIQANMPVNACMDCIFWYRCRGGKLDCLFRAPLNMTDSVRA